MLGAMAVEKSVYRSVCVWGWVCGFELTKMMRKKDVQTIFMNKNSLCNIDGSVCA